MAYLKLNPKTSDKKLMLDKSWVLLDGITKIQSQPLQTEQLQLAILKMTERDWTRFYVWTPGWTNWQLLKDFLSSDQKEFAISGMPLSEENVKAHILKQIDPSRVKPIFQNELTVTRTKTKPSPKVTTKISTTEDNFNDHAVTKDFNGDLLEETVEQSSQPPEPLSFKEINEAYKKRAERHELKIEILLINQKGKTFKSYSKNISLTGTLLEDNIPFDFYGVQFDLIVVNRNSLNPQNSRVQVRAETVGEGLTQRVRFTAQTDVQKKKLTTLLNDYINQQANLKKSS